ncbi:ClpXP protease specificity-enhancing factor SspB [Mariprofundus ferrinatatus]|nr:ClpXP protease specificity-enhancing factor SspB [Mariprofundus ferrinatatus]
MSLSFTDAAKAKQLREYFARNGRIYIVIDATGDDVQVPESLMGDPALRLVLNARMPQAIHIRDDALDSDFSFSGTIFPCKIPMHRIWAAYLPEGDLEQGIIWDDAVPEMIRAIVQAVRSNLAESEAQDETGAEGEQSAEGLTGAASPASSPITVINGGGEQKQGAEEAQPQARKTGHLRVVK